MDTRIKIELWDKKIIGSSFLGCIVTYPSEIMWNSPPYEKWYQLQSRKRSTDTGISGSINVRFNLSFRLGPSKSLSSQSNNNNLTSQTNSNSKNGVLSSPFSKIFSFNNNDENEEQRNPRKEIENIDIHNFVDYYRYLLFIVLLESCEQEERKAEGESKRIPIRANTDLSSPIDSIINSKGAPRSLPNSLHSSLPNFSTYVSPRKVGSLRNMREKCKPVKPPSDLQWLLDNFLERYNIQQTFSYLSVLEILTNSFALTSDHLLMIHYSLMDLESHRSTETLLWKGEVKLYEKYVQNELKNILDDVLSNYFVRFPENKPENALSIVIVIYSLLTTTDTAKLSHILTEKAESAMVKMYKSFVGDRPTEETLIEACKFVSAVIEADHELFSTVFPSEVELTKRSANIYYSEMLSKNISSLLRTSPPISENIMTLYAQLKKLNQKIIKYNPDIEVMPLSHMFHPFVSKWIERIGDQLPSWCHNSIKAEDWLALSYDESNPVLHSSSVQELFDVIYELYDTYKNFEMRAAKDLKNFQKIIEEAIRVYVKGVTDNIYNEIGSTNFLNPKFSKDISNNVHRLDVNESSGKKKTSSLSISDQITAVHCAWIMNLEVITIKLYDFCTQMMNDGEKGSEDSKHQFSDLFSYLKEAQSQLTNYIAIKYNQNPNLLKSLDEIILDPPENINKVSNNDIISRIEPLFDYTNNFVKTLCENLDFKVCIKVVEEIWKYLVDDIESLIYPSVPGKKPDYKCIIFMERIFPFLIEFFHANGEGLSKNELEKASESLRSAFEMFKLPTSHLINIYTDLENGLKPQGSNFLSIDPVKLEIHTITLIATKKNDKEAKKFAKLNRDKTVARAVIKSFGLPSTETLIEWYTCRKGKEEGIPGYLFITTNYICFDTVIASSHQIKIPFKMLLTTRKKKSSFTNLTLLLKNGVVISFHSLSKPKVHDIIESQAEKNGISLEKHNSDEKLKVRRLEIPSNGRQNESKLDALETLVRESKSSPILDSPTSIKKKMKSPRSIKKKK